MKLPNIILRLFVVITLCSYFQVYSECFDCPDKKVCNCAEWGIGNYLPRPQAQFWPAFFNPYLYTCSSPCERGHSFFAGYRYSQSMNGNRIARCLFGVDERGFAGTMANSRTDEDWVADDFGLAPNFSGQIFFNPSIKNHMFDLDARFEFGNWASCLNGLYVNLFTSLVYSRWNLGASAVQQTPPITNNDQTFSSFPPCYMSTLQSKASKDLETVLSGDYLFGDMQTQWRFNRILLDKTFKSVNFADLHMMLGYDFLQKPWYHVGAFLVGVAPIGNHMSPEYVFQPIIGNGHHWEFGAGLDAHFNLWNCNEKCLQFFVNAYMTHLFGTTEFRTFDLQPSTKNTSGIGSRFMLLKEFDDTNTYTGNLINALNFTTREIKSSFDMQGEITAQLLLRLCNWSFAAGYNMFARSCETIAQAENPSRQNEGKRYGLMGTSGVCTQEWIQGQGKTGNMCPLGYHATESQNRLTDAALPGFVDNPTAQKIIDDTQACVTWYSPDDSSSINNVDVALDSQIGGLPAPVLVGASGTSRSLSTDIDYKRIPSQITHGFFAHIDYEWNDECRCFQPYMGLGGSVEFAQNGQCKVCSTNQWSIWLNGGINF